VQSRAFDAQAPLGSGDGVDRRAVLRGLASGLAAATFGGAVRFARAADSLTATSVAPGLTLLGGAGANILVLATDAGKVVVDGGAAASSKAVQQKLAELPGGSVAALFNTHWHLEQVGANEVLGGAGATIYAHAKTRQRLTAGYYLAAEDRYQPPLAPSGRPTKPFHTEAAAVVGKTKIEYGYLLEAHTDGDIYVFFPDVNVVAVGDVVSPQRDPEFDWFGGGWLGGRLDSLTRLLTLGDQDTRFVPSVGPPVGRAQVQAELDMHSKLFDRMVEHVRLGETAADMLKAGVLDGLGRSFEDPAKLLYDVHKGFWAHHNTLTHDIV
jgi:glyoxylase-like metal-dependent hydrolase (beta-lactamase superfamily II)